MLNIFSVSLVERWELSVYIFLVSCMLKVDFGITLRRTVLSEVRGRWVNLYWMERKLAELGDLLQLETVSLMITKAVWGSIDLLKSIWR